MVDCRENRPTLWAWVSLALSISRTSSLNQTAAALGSKFRETNLLRHATPETSDSFDEKDSKRIFASSASLVSDEGWVVIIAYIVCLAALNHQNLIRICKHVFNIEALHRVRQ